MVLVVENDSGHLLGDVMLAKLVLRGRLPIGVIDYRKT
jgi:hypothetical protein